MKPIRSAWLWFIIAIVAAAVAYFWIVLSQPPLPSFKATENGLGQLEVTTSPTGASVSLDGKAQSEKTPLTLSQLKPGTHSISITAEGYATKDQQVNIQAGRTTRFFTDLTTQ
jgi:hypothetical protein